jgi:predicted dehydrogenase
VARQALEIGQVGCGEWGRLVLRDLVELGARVHVVARSAESRRRASDGGAASIVATVDDLPEVQGIVVVVPTPHAPDLLTNALTRGVPVFTEKPLAADAASARELARVGAGRLFVMDKWRYQAAVGFMAELVASGRMGAPVGLHTRRLGPRNSRREVDPILHLAPHDLAIALEILGSLPEPVAAVGHRDDEGVGGMTALLGRQPWLALEVSGRHPLHQREVRLYLEHGSVRLVSSDLEQVAIFSAATGEWRLQRVLGEMPLLAELRAFLLHLSGGPAPRTSAAEASHAVSVLEELRRMAGLID